MSAIIILREGPNGVGYHGDVRGVSAVHDGEYVFDTATDAYLLLGSIDERATPRCWLPGDDPNRDDPSDLNDLLDFLEPEYRAEEADAEDGDDA